MKIKRSSWHYKLASFGNKDLFWHTSILDYIFSVIGGFIKLFLAVIVCSFLVAYLSAPILQFFLPIPIEFIISSYIIDAVIILILGLVLLDEVTKDVTLEFEE